MDEQAVLRVRLKELAAVRIRYGYRRLHILLRREGSQVNAKRVYRIYREENLSLQTKTPRRRLTLGVTTTGGYALHIKDNKVTYYYDYFGFNDYKIESTALPKGKVTLKMDFKYDGGGAGKGRTAALFVNGKKAGEGRVGKTIPGVYSEDTFDIGMDPNASVVRGGKTPYTFTGMIDNVKIDLKPAKATNK